MAYPTNKYKFWDGLKAMLKKQRFLRLIYSQAILVICLHVEQVENHPGESDYIL